MDNFESDDARLWRLLKEVRETVPGATPMPLKELFRIAKIEGYVRVDNYGHYNREKVQRTIGLARTWAAWEGHRGPQILSFHSPDSPYEDCWELLGPDADDDTPCACTIRAAELGRYAKAVETFRTPLPDCHRIWHCWAYWAFVPVKRKVSPAPAPAPAPKPKPTPQSLATMMPEFIATVQAKPLHDAFRTSLTPPPREPEWEDTAAYRLLKGKPLTKKMKAELDAQYDKAFRKR